MIKLVTEEIPTRATKILALKLSVGGSPLFSLLSMPILRRAS